MITTAIFTNCGRVENINLLDGGGEDFGKEEDALECIACYGPGWLPLCDDDLRESICADLQSKYWELEATRWIGA